MPYCFSCGNEIREGNRFCNICGTPLDKPVFCIKCGLPMSRSAAFCRRCGTPNHAKNVDTEPIIFAL